MQLVEKLKQLINTDQKTEIVLRRSIEKWDKLVELEVEIACKPLLYGANPQQANVLIFLARCFAYYPQPKFEYQLSLGDSCRKLAEATNPTTITNQFKTIIVRRRWNKDCYEKIIKLLKRLKTEKIPLDYDTLFKHLVILENQNYKQIDAIQTEWICSFTKIKGEKK
jgi:hypothetical protein